MASYVVLFNWTEQGIKNYKDSPSRVEAARQGWAGADIQIKEIYWTLGAHDLVGIVEAPNDETLTRALLSLGAQGNVRTTTLRAFSAEEFAKLT
jgi:uncharacterized protein with GYD domain